MRSDSLFMISINIIDNIVDIHLVRRFWTCFVLLVVNLLSITELVYLLLVTNWAPLTIIIITIIIPIRIIRLSMVFVSLICIVRSVVLFILALFSIIYNLLILFYPHSSFWVLTHDILSYPFLLIWTQIFYPIELISCFSHSHFLNFRLICQT